MKNNFWEKLNKPILALAPMAGVSDSAFRQICKLNGADVVYTEMVSADALHYNSKKTLAMLSFRKVERPVVCQLFGKRPQYFAKAAKIVTEFGFDGIDINFGCPARKVVAHGGGVTLMRDFKVCREIINTVCENTNLPVSIKIRSSINKHKGKDSSKITAFDFITEIKDLPIKAVMVHGRPYEEPFAGVVDFSMIKKVKDNFSGIVLGNGGINSPEDAEKMISKTGVDGLGLARGLYGKPWLFRLIKDYLKSGEYFEFDFKQIKKVAIKHVSLAQKEQGERGLLETRKHLAYYVRGFPGSSALRSQLVQAKSLEEIKQIFKQVK